MTNDFELMASIPSEEQETTISYCRNEQGAEVWTSDRTVMTKLDRLTRDAPDSYSLQAADKDASGLICSKTYYIKSKSLLSFRSRTKSRDLTDEEREELRERGRTMRAAQLAR